MRGFLSHYKILLVSICLILLGLHFASSALNKGENTGRLGLFVISIYSPIHKIISWPFRKAGGFFDQYIYLVNLKGENERLKKENDVLHFQTSRMTEMEAENDRMKRLLGFRTEAKAAPIYAKVIARNATQEFRVILIGKGSRDGIRKNMIAVTAEGLAGHVSDVSDNAAKILLIVDASSVVDAVVQRTRVSGLVKGRGADTCIMDFIHRTDDVQVGDAVASSGIGGVFPKGYVIGNVVLVDNESNDMFKTVEIMPAVAFGRLEEVIILPGAESSPEEPKREPERNSPKALH